VYMMQSNAMKIQQLQSRIDVLNTIIASRNTSSALGNCQQLLQAEKDRYNGICCTYTKQAQLCCTCNACFTASAACKTYSYSVVSLCVVYAA